MKGLRLLGIVMALLSIGSVWAGPLDKQILREKCLAVDAIHEKYEKSMRLQASDEPPDFPSGHPESGYYYGEWAWFDDTFNIYLWRENGHLWIEIEPTSEYPFICGAAFSILQDGIQYDSVLLETLTGDSQCGEVYIPSVYWFTQWEHLDNVADLDRGFTLVYDGGDNTYFMNVGDDPGYACGDYNHDGVVDQKDVHAKALDLFKNFTDWRQNCWLPDVTR